MKLISEANINDGVRVLVRADWNEPIEDGKVLDTSRIEASHKTIDYVLKRGGSAIVLSHLGKGEESLRAVAEVAQNFFPNNKIIFAKDPWSEEGVEILKNLNSGEIVVIENIRFWKEEEENDENFSKKLGELADIYVNEAFSASHREHASIVGVPKHLPSYVGFHFYDEVEKLSFAFDPEHPFLFILGGAKFETKLPLVEKFLKIADDVFIGGALAQKAVLEPQYALGVNPKIIYPVGDIAALDANTETLEVLQQKIDKAKFVLWNGPLGKYEDNYKEGTLKLAQILGNSKAKVIVGGGDTENVIDELGITEKFYFISLAGGAMLDFLALGTLPGIEAIK